MARSLQSCAVFCLLLHEGMRLSPRFLTCLCEEENRSWHMEKVLKGGFGNMGFEVEIRWKDARQRTR